MISLAVLAGAGPASAADIQSEPSDDDPNLFFISIAGEIEPGDVAKFRREALKADRAVVALSSDGGRTAPAIEIGRLVRLRGYDTLVLNSESCNSACALIWLAGEKRYLSKSAKVGFHATYLERGGAKQESGVGNAVVGSYLASLSLSERAVVFATSAPPDRLNWLSHANAAEKGFSVVEIDDVTDDEATSASEGTDSRSYRTVGNWKIQIDDTLGHGCFAFGQYDDDLAIRIGIDARDPLDGYLMFFGSHWKSIKVGDPYEIELKFGSGKTRKYKFRGIEIGSVKGIVVSFTGTEIFDTFQAESSVRVKYRGEEIAGLKLSDSRAAIDMVFACQREQAKPDPFAK